MEYAFAKISGALEQFKPDFSKYKFHNLIFVVGRLSQAHTQPYKNLCIS